MGALSKAATVLTLPALITATTVIGDHDLWVYTSAWYPQICKEETFIGSTICKEPLPSMTTSMATESLVPIYMNGEAQTGMCNYEYGTFVNRSIEPIGVVKLQQVWPYLNAVSQASMWAGDKTGTPQYNYTCSGMTQLNYLKKIVEMTEMLGTPSIIAQNIGKTVDQADVRAAYEANGVGAVLQCDNAGGLARVITCYAKNESLSPSERAPCPPAIAMKDSCKVPILSIASSQATGPTSKGDENPVLPSMAARHSGLELVFAVLHILVASFC
jgi:hypothetical protein